MEIELTDITKRFGSTVALDDVSLQLSGNVNLLLGSNGSGKTTIINLIAGLSFPNNGTLVIDGAEYGSKKKRAWRNATERVRKKSTFWLDKPGLPQSLSGKDLLKFESKKNGGKSDSFDELLEKTFPSSLDLNKPISSYSSGMQQKLGIISTLVGSPELVVWDEPTAALDATSRKTVARLAKDYASRNGTKFLIASHIPGDFEGVADWIGLMQLGRMLKCGSISELSASDSGDNVDYEITTDKAREVAGMLFERGLARSVSIVDSKGGEEGSEDLKFLAVRVSKEFEEATVARLAHEEIGAKEFKVRKREKSITELYMESLS